MRVRPSGLDRAIGCPGAPYLEEQVVLEFGPDTSKWASEGQVAHYVSDAALRGHDPRCMLGHEVYVTERKGTVLLEPPEEDHRAFTVTQDMLRHVESYVGLMKAEAEIVYGYPDPPLVIKSETKIRIDHLLPGLSGTPDAAIMNPRGAWFGSIGDLKYGQGVYVDHIHPAQQMAYHIGQLGPKPSRLHLEKYQMARIAISQPRYARAKANRIWTCSVEYLRLWEERIARPMAELALQGAPVYRMGSWCRFCKAKKWGRCPLLARDIERSLGASFEALANPGNFEALVSQKLTPAQISSRLAVLDQLQEYIKGLLTLAEDQSRQGFPVPGWKRVGVQGNRKWSGSEGSVTKKLRSYMEEHGGVEVDLYKDPSLLTPNQVIQAFKAAGYDKKEVSELVYGQCFRPYSEKFVKESEKGEPLPTIADVFKPLI